MEILISQLQIHTSYYWYIKNESANDNMFEIEIQYIENIKNMLDTDNFFQ